MTRSSPASKGLEGVLTNIGTAGGYDDQVYTFSDGTVVDGIDVGGISVRMKGGDTVSHCAANWTYEDGHVKKLQDVIQRKARPDVHLADPTILILDGTEETKVLAEISLPDILRDNRRAAEFGFMTQYGNGHWIYVHMTRAGGGFKLDIYDSLDQGRAERDKIYGMTCEYLAEAGIRVVNIGDNIDTRFHIPKLQNVNPLNPTLHCGAYALDACESVACNGMVENIWRLREDGNDKISAFLRARDVVRFAMSGEMDLAGVANYAEVRDLVMTRMVEQEGGVGGDVGVRVVSTAPARDRLHPLPTANPSPVVVTVAPPVPIKDKCNIIFKFLEERTGLNDIDGLISVMRPEGEMILVDESSGIDVAIVNKNGTYDGEDSVIDNAFRLVQERLRKEAGATASRGVATHTAVAMSGGRGGG